MTFDSWDALRTAWEVARAGTVSGAADALGVHHATVIRHVDALEARLGVKLFHRHARGYTPTEAGQALAQVGRATDEQFAQLAARLTGIGAGISGDLIITTVPEVCELLLPALAGLRAEHSELRLQLRTERRVLRLEYGEAHVAIRAGARPEEPDNVVQKLGSIPVALFAAPAYLDRHGTPATDDDLAAHLFVAGEVDSRAPFARWLEGRVPSGRMILRSNDLAARIAAIRAGFGLGFLFDDAPAGLVRVMGSRPDWAVDLWLVTHVDLHRTPKVQAVLTAIKKVFAE